MSGDNVAALMLPALFALVFLGLPVSFALISVAFVFGYGVLGGHVTDQVYGSILAVASTYVLTAVPPFIFMGAVLERSGIAERLYNAMQLWLGRLPGGLAVATIAICVVFAGATGIVGAVETVVGLMAIPAMMKGAYDKGLIAGTICSGGSLGTIIPPSIVCIIYASIGRLSVGDLFAGIMIPGGLMAAFFVSYLVLRCALRPVDGPRMPREAFAVPLARKLKVTATALVPALGLVVAVVGSIVVGIASPTEAAAVGALAVLALTAAYGELSWRLVLEALRKTLTINAMILLIVTGGTMFTNVFIVLGGGRLLEAVTLGFDLGALQIVAIFLAITFVAGCVLDWVSVVLICLPIFAPIIARVGVDPLWFAVMMIIVIQTSYLTPPMAPSIFYLRAIAPPDMTYRDMYVGVAPFVACQVLVLAVVALLPEAATYLPSLFRRF